MVHWCSASNDDERRILRFSSKMLTFSSSDTVFVKPREDGLYVQSNFQS